MECYNIQLSVMHLLALYCDYSSLLEATLIAMHINYSKKIDISKPTLQNLIPVRLATA
ncbi:hypothetical protein LguiA_030941 [Lonicera macranthoides]